MNIYDIPVTEILDQYIAYMERLQKNNIELSSEFIIMAAELIYIKSKMLLPKEEKDKEDPRGPLTEMLIEYGKIKETAGFLYDRMEKFFARYPAKGMKPVINRVLKEEEAGVLLTAMKNILFPENDKPSSPINPGFESFLNKKVISVGEKVIFVLKKLVRTMPYKGYVYFSDLLPCSENRSGIVATFLAVLELIKSGRIKMENCDDNYIIILNRS